MASTFPSISSQSALIQTIEQFRKSFPRTSITAETLQSLELAPKNESFVINILKFLNLVSDDGTATERAKFFYGGDEEFSKGMEAAVRDAYAELFQLHNEAAWELEEGRLATFFRTRDSATELMGRRKANTFSTLAALANKRSSTTSPAKPPAKTARSKRETQGNSKSDRQPSAPADYPAKTKHDIDFAIRVEINLPATTEQAVYQAIFKSLREDLLNG